MRIDTRPWKPARFVASASIVLLMVGWAGIAKAGPCTTDPGNIVADCGFDNENASGGPVTVTNPVTWTFTGDAGIDTTNPLSAPNDGFLGTGGINQSLSLTPGASYLLSFWLAADQTTINNANEYDLDLLLGADCSSDPQCFNASVTVSFDGQQLDQIFADDGNFTAAGVYANSTYTASSNDNLGDLVFTGSQNPNSGNTGTWYLDEVQVNCIANCTTLPASIPEPGGLPLLVTAFASWFGLRRIHCKRRFLGRVADFPSRRSGDAPLSLLPSTGR
jgi:hypothetical protein